jgi:hypothetical protein
MAEPTLYERLGGIYAVAAVVDHFSDQLLKNPKVVESNPELNEWHTKAFSGRLAGLKFLRTLPVHGERAARCTFRLEDPPRSLRRGPGGAWTHP